MASYNLRFNKDDSVIRHIVVGLTANLTEKVSYNQVVAGELVPVSIPFMFSFTGDENWMNENFLVNQIVDNFSHDQAIGNYETMPRGVISLVNVSIDSASLVNKYVRGTYEKLEKDGTMRSYVSQFQMIPIRMTFDAKIFVETILDVFRVLEKIVKKLYKNNPFNIDAGSPDQGTYRIACAYKMPEDYEMKRPIQFGFDDKKRRSIEFSLELTSFIPSFEPGDEQFSGNRMLKIIDNVVPVLDVKTLTPLFGTHQSAKPKLKNLANLRTAAKNKDSKKDSPDNQTDK